jgi:hypothetical protein
MKNAHAHLGITDVQFDRVAQHLSDELAALGVDNDVAAELLALVGTLRPDIVSRHPSAAFGPVRAVYVP